MELKERLAEVRMEHRLTQEELADKIGVTRQSISKWERGVISPSAINLIALGKLYGISLDVLVDGEPPAVEQEEATPRKKHLPLKIMGAAAAAALVLLVSASSVVTIVSAVAKEKEPEEPEDNIIWTDDLVPEDIDLSQVEDWTDSVTIIDP